MQKLKKFFDARYSSFLRQYIYKIKNLRDETAFDRGFVHFVKEDLDLALLNSLAFLLEGEDRDFYSFDFTKDKKGEGHSTKRDLLFARFYKKDKLIIFKIVANAFLYHQVRAMTGEILRLCCDKTSTNKEKLSYFESLFYERRSKVKFIASAEGLYLDRIYYSKKTYDKFLRDFKKRHGKN